MEMMFLLKNDLTQILMSSIEIRRNRLLIPSLIIVLVLTLKPSSGHGMKLFIPHLDKIAHFGMFFFLAINMMYKFEKSYKLLEYLLFCITLGFITEILQDFIPGRSLDFYDAFADILGIIAAYYVYQMMTNFIQKTLKILGA